MAAASIPPALRQTQSSPPCRHDCGHGYLQSLPTPSPPVTTTALIRHGYLQSLPPEGEYLPFMWSEEELVLLRGTELDGQAEADRCGRACVECMVNREL